MRIPFQQIMGLATVTLLLFGAAPDAQAQSVTQASVTLKEASLSTHAKGTFDVKITPQAADSTAVAGRMSIDKQWQGDFEGTSKGEMLTGMSVKNSGVYVAIERVTGTLQGKKGSFLLHHTGVMTRGEGQLTISVVPDSGTDELAGISGSMTIIIEGGKHYYDFEYTLGSGQ